MNCRELDSILDGHEVHALSAARRAHVDAHLATCRRCAGVWFAAEALAQEPVAIPSSELFSRTMGRLGEHEIAAPSRRRSVWWVPAAGLAAAAAAVVLTLSLGISPRHTSIERELPAVAAPIAEAPAAALAADRAPGRDRARFLAGTHYQRLSPEYATAAGPGRIEVAEFFMFGCFPCYAFEPHLEAWRARRADDIDFVRVPALFNALAALHARAFYAAEALGRGDDFHAEFFREVHVNGNRLDSEASLAEFFGRFGVDRDTFRAVIDSSAVRAKLQQAETLNARYAIAATPSVVVNGKYLSSPAMAGSYEAVFELVDELVESERATCVGSGCPLRRSER
jgi:protein dithiol oxidoreductase (disulfide-forming)